MQLRTWTILLSLAWIVTGCYDSSLDATNSITENRINYNFDSFDRSNQPNDPFRIVGITPSGVEWKVIVEYSGGCNEHSFYTWWEEDFFSEDPLQAGFSLSHDSNGDACEAVIRDTLVLNMEKVVGRDFLKASITIVNARSQRRVNVDADLARIAQTGSCELAASIESNTCGLGIWDDQWLLLKDSIGAKGKVWIIPVKNDAGISLDAPASGDYKIGVTFLFGHFNSNLTSECYVLDDALAVPAQINCISAN